MTINELGNKLKEMYENAPKGDCVTMIHLFGVQYADEILNNKYSRKDIIDISGIAFSYLTELNKGINLSKYVKSKKMSKERDAYTKLFEHIDKGLFFQSGINDIVFIDNETIEKQWILLKNAVFQNQSVSIRGYGRDAKRTDLYFKLYEKIFGNTNIFKDSTNNAEPTKLLKNLTTYSKTKQTGKTLIMNYQISHLFGRTKNPLLFTCPWNIAYIPKYLDPFTGHETQGQYSKQFKQIFLSILKEKFKHYIEEYNTIINTDIAEKIDESLRFVKSSTNITTDEFRRFETDVRNELSEI